jgi:hypothetical protein
MLHLQEGSSAGIWSVLDIYFYKFATAISASNGLSSDIDGPAVFPGA